MDGSYKHSNPPEIKGTGYVVKTLEAALWAFYHTDDFESGCLKVVNLGDDADTTAAVYGQLAGAFYGVEGIPKKWLDKCALSPLIELMADEIVSMADHYSSVKPAAPLDTAEFVSTSAACSDEPVAPADETQASASSETSASGKFKASEHYRQKKRGYDLLEAEVRTHRSSRAVREEIRGSRSAYDIILEKYRKLPPDSQDECLLTSTMNQLYRA
ncbi:uncharacterized protein LOC135826407 [Sycon ciliatum]|uniref:uncharacterized protein LOC135826407 n=1 Tax=Sycon ciliatum TaxID=27933 RepID=UPI0031F6BE12